MSAVEISPMPEPGEIVELAPIDPSPMFSTVMSLHDAATFGLLVAIVTAVMLLVHSCWREADARAVGCRIRWSHASTVPDSLLVAAKCGSDGMR